MSEKMIKIPMTILIALQAWICIQIIDLKSDVAAIKATLAAADVATTQFRQSQNEKN